MVKVGMTPRPWTALLSDGLLSKPSTSPHLRLSAQVKSLMFDKGHARLMGS
jgi:hypothetical protein